MEGRRSEDISPTAHYTGYVWARNDLSDPDLATDTGRALFYLTEPVMLASRLVGGPTMEGFLLARHRIIDHLLGEAVETGRVGQVIEVASGLSPRGLNFARRYGERLTYVEADLPDMAARKRAALAGTGSLGEHHRVVEIDALADSGPASIGAIAAALDEGVGLAIITEGLINYFDREAVEGMWGRFARTLERFGDGVYLSDLILASSSHGLFATAWGALLSVFVRGRVHLHFEDEQEALVALRAAGFGQPLLHRAEPFADRLEDCDRAGAEVVRVIDAGVRR